MEIHKLTISPEVADMELSTIIALIFGTAFYFLPTIIALASGKSNALAITALNIFLGCTLVGWVVALVWSLSNDPIPQKIIVGQRESDIDRLARLKKLLDEKVLTQEEFEIEKNKILGR